MRDSTWQQQCQSQAGLSEGCVSLNERREQKDETGPQKEGMAPACSVTNNVGQNIFR